MNEFHLNLPDLFDAADEYERESYYKISWALAEAARAGTPPAAMEILAEACHAD